MSQQAQQQARLTLTADTSYVLLIMLIMHAPLLQETS